MVELVAQLKAQCEALQEAVLKLEQEKKHDAELLAAAEAELQEFRRIVCATAFQDITEADWETLNEADYTIPLEDVVAELEEQDGQ